MLEKAIEARLLKECNKLGWLCLKQNVVGRRGYPDRLIITNKGTHIWVELKTDTGRLTEGQSNALLILSKHYCHTCVFYGMTEMLAGLRAMVDKGL